MSRFSERRSKVSPMDFEYTSEELNKPPAWDSSEAATRKRTLSEMNSSVTFGVPSTPQRAGMGINVTGTPTKSTFSSFTPTSSNTPFLFHSPPNAMSTPHPNSVWKPPEDFKPSSKASVTDSTNGTNVYEAAVDISDVSMNDDSPLLQKGKPKMVTISEPKSSTPNIKEDEEEGGKMALIPTRKTSAHAVRRVYRGKEKAKDKLSTTNKARMMVEEDEVTDENEDEEDGEQRAGLAKQESITSNHHYTFNMPSVPVSRSEVPYMLLGYVQFFFNLSLVLVFLYILVYCIITIQRDVEHRMSHYRTELAEQIASCTQLYEINKCFPISQRVPALSRQCNEWEICMQKDPTAVGRARVVAETIGEVINSFVEPISWKTLIFGLTSLGFLIILINVLFSLYRSRIAPEPAPSHPPIRHASLPPVFPSTPVHTRYMTPPVGYADPVSPLRLDQPVDWGRTWSGTEMPVRANTPGRGKKRV